MNRHYDYAPPSDFQNRSPFASYHSAASVQAPPHHHHHHQERRHPPRGEFTGNNTYNNGGSSVDAPAMLQTSTLFLGDLSVNCDEERLFDLFCQFGEIETVQLKKSERDPQRTHLGFGFIKFTTREAAERALNALNGYFFLGRALRVGWAEDYDKRNHQRLKTGKTSNTYFPRTMDPKNRQTAQIHITFVSRELNKRVSEVELGDVFGRFGNLIDIAIKKNAINPDQHTQSGYAFVHYNLTDEGVRSAVMAVEQTNNRNYDHMAFQSKVTHSLQAHIFAMKYRGGAGAGGPPAPPQAAPTFSEPRSNFNYPPRAPFSAPSTYSDPSISPPTHYLGESSYTSSSGYVISPPQTTSTYHQNFDYSPPQHSSHAPSSYYTDTSSSTYQQNLPPAAASIYDHHSIIVNDEYSLMKGNSPSNSRSPSHSNSTTDRFPTNNNTMFAMDATFYETIPAGRSNSFTTGSNNNSITGENEEDLVHHLTSL